LTGKGIIANVKDLAPRWLVGIRRGEANTFNIAAVLAAMSEAPWLVTRFRMRQ